MADDGIRQDGPKDGSSMDGGSRDDSPRDDSNVRFTEREALFYHSTMRPGKIEIIASKPMATQRDLSLAYSPGVAVPVQAIADNPACAYDYTAKGNLVAVITNGTAILGMGNLGALASKPVMEGKAVLFKRFADVNSIDLCVDNDLVCDLHGSSFSAHNQYDELGLVDQGASYVASQLQASWAADALATDAQAAPSALAASSSAAAGAAPSPHLPPQPLPAPGPPATVAPLPPTGPLT